MLENRNYTEDGTLTLDSPIRGDSDGSLVGLAGGAAVEIVAVDQRTRTTFSNPVEAIAVGQYVTVLAGDTVHALTKDGVTVWSTDIGGASDVGVVDDGGIVGVLSGETVVGLDIESGSELFAVKQPSDRPAPEGVVGAAWGVVLPAWSYITAYDTRGEEQFTANLDGTIETVGALDRRAVVSLRGDEALALTPSGERVWRRRLGIQWLAPTGGSTLPAITEHGTVLLTDEGKTKSVQVGSSDADAVYRTCDDRVYCMLVGDEVTIYRRLETSPGALTVEMVTEEIEPEGEIEMYISNKSDEPMLTEMVVEAESARLEHSAKQVSLGPDDERILKWSVQSVGDEEVTVEVMAGAATLSKETIAVAGTPPKEWLAASAEPVSIERGTATFKIELTNNATRPIENARIDPPGKPLTTIQPDESTTVEQSVTFESGGKKTIRVRGKVGSNKVTADASVVFPEAGVDLSVTRTEAKRDNAVFADVRLDNNFDIPVTDDLQVHAPDRVHERSVVIPRDGVFTLALPVSREGAVEASVDGLEISDRLGEKRSKTTTQFDAVFETGNEPAVRVEREATDALVGYAIQERLVLRNDGAAPAVNLRVTVGDGEWTTDKLDPGEKLTLKRRHVASHPGQVTLEGGKVTHANGKVPIEPVDVSVRTAEIKSEAVVEVGTDKNTISLTVENDSDEYIEIERVGTDPTADSPVIWNSDDLGSLQSIPSGGSAAETWRLPGDRSDFPDQAVRVAFLYRCPSNSDETKLQTLAPIGGGSGRPIEISITDGMDIAAGKYGYLQVSVANVGTQPVEGLSIEANHTALTTRYTPERNRHLGQDDSFDHEIDLNPISAGEIQIDIRVDGELSGDPLSERYVATGPVAPPGEWNKSQLTEWEITAEKDVTDDSRTERDEIVATGYVREGTPR